MSHRAHSFWGMGRVRRIDPEGAMHHVVSRGNNQWPIFLDDIDRRRFVATLGKVCERYRMLIIAHCLMDNHFHLVVHCPDAQLSEAMRDLKSQYATWFRWRHGSNGPRFDGRFFSDVVTSFVHLKRLIRYIHRNPLAMNPNMHLGDYWWSSHAIYEGTRPAPVWFDTQVGPSLFSDLRTEIELPIASDDIQNRVPGGPRCLTARPRIPSIADIRIAVAHAGRRDLIEVHPSRRNGLAGLTLVIAQDHYGYTVAEVAAPIGYNTERAARQATQRGRKRLQGGDELLLTLNRALSALEQSAA